MAKKATGKRRQADSDCVPELSEAELLKHLVDEMSKALWRHNLEDVRLYAGRLVSLMNEWDGWRKP